MSNAKDLKSGGCLILLYLSYYIPLEYHFSFEGCSWESWGPGRSEGQDENRSVPCSRWWGIPPISVMPPPTTSRGYVGIYGGDLVVACPAPRAEIRIEPWLSTVRLVSRATPLNHKERGVWWPCIQRVVCAECNNYKKRNGQLQKLHGQL